MIIEMLSDPQTDRMSHKRVIAFLSFWVLVGMVAFSILDKPVNIDLVWTFAGLCGGQSVLSIFERKINNSVNSKQNDDTKGSDFRTE